MAMVSPSDSCFSITGSPLTSVPLVLPRSLIQNDPARISIRPWWPEVAGSPTTTSLSGARPMLTIWFGKATIRPANGPDSKLRSAANPVPDATCSGGIACSETVPLGSALGSVCCQTGITDVASSNDPASAGAPLPGAAAGDPDGQATSVELTSGVAAPAGCRAGCVMAVDAIARSGSGSAPGSGVRGSGFGRVSSTGGSGSTLKDDGLRVTAAPPGGQ